MEIIDTFEECVHLENAEERWSGPGTYQKAYDTARAYLTLCYNIPQSEHMFGVASADNDSRSDDLNRFVEFREWLKSVLYLRRDSLWYCWDVEEIDHSFSYFPGHGIYENGGIAIERFILEHQLCDSNRWKNFLRGSIGGRYETWRDTVKDSNLTPLDTVVPSLEDIGLSILRGPQSAVYQPHLIDGDQLLDLRVTENPFTKNTDLAFTLNDYGLVKFELFDVLGKLQTSNGIGQVLGPGEHTFKIDGSLLIPGVYYARLSYHNGDTKSIMIRKE